MRARVSRSQRSTHQIMANSGFGDLILHKGGTKIIVPQKYITRDGYVYKRINTYILEKNFEALEERGVVVV